MFFARKLFACSVIALLAPLVAPLLLQTPEAGKGPPDQTGLYPAVRQVTAVHAFSLPEDIKADVVRKALAELSTKDAECRVLYGPVKATARPSKVFVVIEAPATVDAKDVIKALKKGVASADLVAWTCFQSADKTLGAGLDKGMAGFSPRDWVLGMSNDLRWFEAGEGFTEFFFVSGKLKADVIADRFHKLAQPFGVKDVGHVVVETFTWPIEVTVGKDADKDGGGKGTGEKAPDSTGKTVVAFDDAAVKKVEKALTKLSGVKSAHVDAAAHTLTVAVALDDLVRGGPVLAMPGGNASDKPADPNVAPAPRMRFDTNAILDALEKEHFSAIAKKEGEDAGPKKGG